MLRRPLVGAAVFAAAAMMSMPGPALADPVTASQLGSLLVSGSESSAPYDRSFFEHWVDEDGDGCDTRREVLIAESQVEPVVEANCTVVSGHWYSWYDDQAWTDPADVDIDHMVPLAEAWQSGAQAWTPELRRAFANDLGFDGSLVAVTDNVNSAKGAGDPAEWLPPEEAMHCRYVTEWAMVKYRWNLSVDGVERASLDSLLSGECGQTVVDLPERANTTPPVDDRLLTDEVLHRDEQLASQDGAFRLVMQSDGNAVVYGPGGAVWATGTGYVGSAFLAMQGDGNLVVYSLAGQPAWASGTAGVHGALLLMQNDGNLVMYRGDGSPAWVNGQLVRPPVSDSLPAGATLPTSQHLRSRNGEWRLVMQDDGHAVVYGPGRIGWTSGTGGVGPSFMAMQGDGNLVIYTNSGRPVWAAGTWGVVNPVLVMQDDGNLVMYGGNGAVWVNGRLTTPPPPAPTKPANPGNSKNCSDFATWSEAQSWFDYYYPHYGDVASLDGDGDGIACESLPGAP